jgi:preprotein translocase subunit SecF
MLELVKNTKIDFMGKRKFAFFFSGILSLIGILAIVQVATGRANLGIDFVGGTSIQLKFEKPVNIHELRKALEEGGIKDFDLQDIPQQTRCLYGQKNRESTGPDIGHYYGSSARNFPKINLWLTLLPS